MLKTLAALLVLAVFYTACFPASDNTCGTGGAAATSSTSSTSSGSMQCLMGSGSACLDCMNAHCCAQYTACINAPDANEGVQCINEAGCWLGTNACPAAPLLPDAQGLAACLNVNCLGICGPPAAGGGAPGAHKQPVGAPTQAPPPGTLPLGDIVVGGGTVKFCENPCAPECTALPASAGFFDPSIFNFVTTIADDGTGDAGGWQQAVTKLGFVIVDTEQSWTCTTTIGMPVRAEYFGVISKTDAATLSAAIANQAWKFIRAASPNERPVNFCGIFKTQMIALFAQKTPYPYYKLGARVDVTSP